MPLVAENATTAFGAGPGDLGQFPNGSSVSSLADKAEETNPETTDFMARIQQVLDDLRRNDGREATAHDVPPGWGEVHRVEAEEHRSLEDGGSLEQGRGQELIDDLRRQVQELEQKLAESERHRATLEQQLADLRANQFPDSTHSELEEKLRVQRLEIERERAELDRQRTELEYERRGLERSRDCDEINERVQVLRQHLQEIHAREQIQRQGGSLTRWISGLREQLGQAVQRWMRPRTERAKQASN